MSFKSLIGRVYNRLTVAERAANNKFGQARWVCNCECGNTKIIEAQNLVKGLTKSCGCLNSEITALRNTVHGSIINKVKPPEYRVWSGMRNRCNNPNNAEFNDYGGRGITVCSQWKSYTTFIGDMGARPTLQHTLDRRDNSKGYSKDNCRWATKIEQARNTRANRSIEYQGIIYGTLKEFSERMGCNYKNLHWRLKRGYSIEESIRKAGNL